ncbi:hypothetical protein [Candidatus Magnetominusculus xianensis]|uniref:Uncharacterized protein n=1 Tax=Candidatus Magnetominusculus xianensis TaxID=1748249 RepID=A0ABR5SIB7_9BACT|nr:hypothetical protein [Candidatus Magnetominusculus xianensis]KWT92164.1 hypothetical protein ASN18_0568 [Candidatus Magnetominusculus xianensis]MBF0404665.1 hypothetical protein [Nitrospirota bacterium]
MDTRPMDGKMDGKDDADSSRNGMESIERFDIPAGQGSDGGYDQFENSFRDVSSVFDALQRLSGRGVAEDAIDHSLNWLILSAWSNLDKMKELQDDIINRLQEIKKATGISN